MGMEDYSLSDCIEEAEGLENLYLELIKNTHRSRYSDGEYHCEVNSKTLPLQREILRRYEIWFEVSRRIVAEYSEDYKQFCEPYENIKRLIGLTEVDSDYHRNSLLERQFIRHLDIQVNILHTIEPIIDITQSSFKKAITADLIDSELEQAEWLYNHEFYRPAGMVGGLILERFLKTLCEVNDITVQDKDSINPLATKLYKSDKLQDFDSTLFKSIQHLADIRNKCSHPKQEPKPQEIRELLDKVKKITFIGL